MKFLDRIFDRLEHKTVNQTRDYFWDAIRVYSRNHDPIIRIAALAAAKKASRDDRAIMVKYLRRMAAVDEPDDYRLPLDQLAEEISFKDWTIRDAIAEGRTLAKFDPEYAEALDRFDSSVFRRRFPRVFD